MGKSIILDESHAKHVSYFSNKLFDELEEIHSLGEKERFILEASAILHDVGYYIDIHNHHEHSAYIIQSFNLPGYNKKDINLISIISYMHRERNIKADERLAQLPTDEFLTVKKLIALLKIADALDASHMQMIQDINVSISETMIKVTAICKDIPYIEEKVFNRKNREFLEIFGVPITLETRINYA